MVYVLLKPGLENCEHYFTSMWDECNCAVVWAFSGTDFLWDWNENWPFPVLWPLLSVGDFRRLWVKWHRTRYKTYKRQTHSGQRKNNNCASKQAHGLFFYSPPGQNSRLYDQTCSVQHMCINVIIQKKGVKFQLTAEPVQSPYHKMGMFPYLQGTINLKAVSSFLAEHLVCKQYISTFSLLWRH